MWQQYADDYLPYAATGMLERGDTNPDVVTSLLRHEAWPGADRATRTVRAELRANLDTDGALK